MKIVDDTLKDNGVWSNSKLMIFFTFWANLVYSGWCVFKTAVLVDIPVGWLGLIVTLYGIKQTANVTIQKAISVSGGAPSGDSNSNK